MKPVNTLYTDWQPVSSLPTEPKLLQKALETGAAAIVADTSLGLQICGLSEDALNTGKILFIRTPFWRSELFYNPSKMAAITAVGYLAMEEYEDAGTIFYIACIENSITYANNLWAKQCTFNENYSGFTVIDGEVDLELQGFFPDIELVKRLQKIIARNERKLKENIRDFETKCLPDIAAYRSTIKSSHIAGLTDAEYIDRFNEDKKYLLKAYKQLKDLVKEMILLPDMFGSRNYLLRGGRYQDIKGICKLVDIADVEKKNWSLNPDDYV